MPKVAVSFANFGPYHVARLRALARRLGPSGGEVVAYETAASQGLYPWKTGREAEPFAWKTLFVDAVLEDLSRSTCADATWKVLDRDKPDVLMTAGYSRPECVAMLRWGFAKGRPVVLMSESQAIDHPRAWWKEAIKRRRARRFSAALVGGQRHREYLISLGVPADRITLGYNAVDGAAFAAAASRSSFAPIHEPYFLSVSRFAPEKNLSRLVHAYARYRNSVRDGRPWDLVLCGGGPDATEIERAIDETGTCGSVHRPGFLQADQLSRWYAHASAFVHPSLLEPWGLVVNEAAACGLPLIVSDRAGAVETFLPEGSGASGYRIDGRDVTGMAEALGKIAALAPSEREAMGRRAAAIAADWGPERFASGAAEAIEIAIRKGPISKASRLAAIG